MIFLHLLTFLCATNISLFADCPPGNFLCPGTESDAQCINDFNICDGISQCWDGFDEMNDTCGKHWYCVFIETTPVINTYKMFSVYYIKNSTLQFHNPYLSRASVQMNDNTYTIHSNSTVFPLFFSTYIWMWYIRRVDSWIGLPNRKNISKLILTSELKSHTIKSSTEASLHSHCSSVCLALAKTYSHFYCTPFSNCLHVHTRNCCRIKILDSLNTWNNQSIFLQVHTITWPDSLEPMKPMVHLHGI